MSVAASFPRHGGRAAAALAAALLATLPQPAEANGELVSAATLPALSATRSTGNALSGPPPAGYAESTVVRTMLWWGVGPSQHRPVALGWGTEQRIEPNPGLSPLQPGAAAQTLLVGVALAGRDGTRLTLQTPASGWNDPTAPWRDNTRQVRVALQFNGRSPLAQFRGGSLLRMELSGQTSLALRPRGGRWGLTLTSHW